MNESSNHVCACGTTWYLVHPHDSAWYIQRWVAHDPTVEPGTRLAEKGDYCEQPLVENPSYESNDDWCGELLPFASVKEVA